jgi:hypothetical protein
LIVSMANPDNAHHDFSFAAAARFMQSAANGSD